MDGTEIESRWNQVGRERAELVLFRARLWEVAREGVAETDQLPSLAPLATVICRIRRSDHPQRLLAYAAECLSNEHELREGIRHYVARILLHARVVAALADEGLLPARGVLEEARERLVAKVLPSLRPPSDLTEVIARLLPSRRDAEWIDAADDEVLVRLIEAMTPDHDLARATLRVGVLRAVTLLSHRLAAAGEDPTLHDADPASHDHDSPFLEQSEAVLLAVQEKRVAEPDQATLEAHESHARVMLSQCREQVARIRKRVPKTGVTVALAYQLERIDDILDRLTLLFDVASSDQERCAKAKVALVRVLSRAHVEGQKVMPLLTRTTRLIASEIVSHAGRTGEHYIARTAREYWRMWGRAAGAGLIVGALACIKVGLGALHAPKLTEALLFSLNYAVGFVVVQMLGFTIATKQPAMTAASLAGSIDSTSPRNPRPLLDTIVCLVRSQAAAIGGNVLIALPFAYLLSMGWQSAFGHSVADASKAEHLLHELSPISSLAVPHAMLTGVWLSLSGIVAGYVSNSMIARHVPDRLKSSRPLLRMFGARRVTSLAERCENGTGTLVGSVVLGVLLGSTGNIAQLLGLPLDIRHVSFASANLGLALHTLGPSAIAFGEVCGGIAAIGLCNLTVSFSLSLGLALHARGRRLRDVRVLLADLGQASIREGFAWILPVGRTAHPG